jgi:hypothetical protein
MKYRDEILVCALFILVIGSVWVGYSYMEARAYNKVTKSEVSTLDAMFLKLRVQESAND